MTLEIQDHPSFGKDLLSLQREAEFPLAARLRMVGAALRLVNGIRREIGVTGTFSLFRDVRRRTAEVFIENDLSEVRSSGISDADLMEMIERIALGEQMIKRMGSEKAIHLRTKLSEELAPDFFPGMFPTFEELDCMEGGYLLNLQNFLAAYATQNYQRGLQDGSIREAPPDSFTLVITSCNFAKVAEIIGDREICYWTTCVTDGYFFPEQAQKAGLRFDRPGTIATGQQACEFCWGQRE